MEETYDENGVGQNNGFSEHSIYDDEWKALENEVGSIVLNNKEEESRKEFVKEYMFDRNPINAAIRCGYVKAVAVRIADRYMSEPYVLRAIRKAEEEFDYQDRKELTAIKRKVVNRLTTEIDNFSIDADAKTRIAASNSLGKLLDMEPNKRVDIHSTGGSPVMVVPGIASIEDWEKAASESQSKLQDDTQEEHDD